ncbi:MAG: hypothetical protein MZV63_61085 [Marinilabiliales bacterium]|nr:hypothetical protein [Marinilabiliales bacterium]
MRWGAYVLMIFWLWYYFHDWRYGLFHDSSKFLFLVLACARISKRFSDLKKNKGLEFSEEDVSEFILMGKAPGRMLDRYSLPALYKEDVRQK